MSLSMIYLSLARAHTRFLSLTHIPYDIEKDGVMRIIHIKEKVCFWMKSYLSWIEF